MLRINQNVKPCSALQNLTRNENYNTFKVIIIIISQWAYK